jgi:hypothetical protein
MAQGPGRPIPADPGAAAAAAAVGVLPAFDAAVSVAAPLPAGPAPAAPGSAGPAAAWGRPSGGVPSVRTDRDPRGVAPMAEQPAATDPTIDPDASFDPTAGIFVAPQAAPGQPADSNGASAAAEPVPGERNPIGAAAIASVSGGAVAALSNAGGSATGIGDGQTGWDNRDREAAIFTAAGAAPSTQTVPGVGAPPAAPLASPTAGPDTAAAADGAGFADRLSGDVARLLASSSREAVLRLSPPELGEVTVRVAVSGRDVSAWFGTPLPSVQQTISQAIGQLQTDLGNAGYTLNGAWVGADASGSESGGTGAFVAAPTRPPAGVSQGGPAAVSAALPSASGVSIYV